MGCGSSKSTSTSSPLPNENVHQNGIHEKQEKNHCTSKSKLTDTLRKDDATDSSMENKHKNGQQDLPQESHSFQHPSQSCTIPPHQENNPNIEGKEHFQPASQAEVLTDGEGKTTTKTKTHSINAVAFEVQLDENSKLKELRRPPKLQKLDHLPILTAEMLAHKQALAEENRQKEIQRKVSKTSKRRKQLLEARELDIQAQEKRLEIETKMNAQNRKRAKHQAEIIEKQRKRELRAIRVRERAQKIKDGEDVAEFEVDPDETYNADEEDDVWDIQPAHNENSISCSTHSKSESNIDSLDNENEFPQDPKSVHDFFEE